MAKMSINEAAEHFGVSKEAIHNRVRRGSLESVLENGVKMVILDENAPKKVLKRAVASKSNDDRYYKFLEEQNSKLQSRVETLEVETRSLRDQKELMLIQERVKIENIYKEKDEQLKNILSSLSSQFMLNSPKSGENIIEEEPLEAEIEVENEKIHIQSKLTSLKKYLKERNLSEKKLIKVKERFKKVAKQDRRIVTIGKKHYLDLSKYDYKDLLK